MQSWQGELLRKAVAVAVLAVGSVILLEGLRTLCEDLVTLSQYSSLQEELSGDPSPLLSRYGDESSIPKEAVAWVQVLGTPISLPVASGDRGFSWYLSHDLWDKPSELGCPFIDPRCQSADARHVIVYGHHLSMSTAMFSPLQLCYQQESFDMLEACLWRTTRESSYLEPLCSLSVECGWQDIMRFSFADDNDLREWLEHLMHESSACSPRALEQISAAHRVITLVTCSSNRSGQPLRTLVVFC